MPSAKKTTKSTDSTKTVSAKKAPAAKKTVKTSSRSTKPTTKAEHPKTAAASTKVNSKLSARERAQKVTRFFATNLRRPKVFVPVIVVLLLVLLYLLRSAFVVALVNGQPVSRAAYQQQLEAQAGKQVMSSLVTQTLIEQEASRRHISISQSELDSQLRTIQNQLALQGQTLDSALAAQGISQSEFMQQLKLQALVQKMLADKVKVTDAEISDYISKNQDSLPTGESQDQIKAQVKQQLQQQKLSQQAQALVQQLQAKAHITYFINQ